MKHVFSGQTAYNIGSTSLKRIPIFWTCVDIF